MPGALDRGLLKRVALAGASLTALLTAELYFQHAGNFSRLSTAQRFDPLLFVTAWLLVAPGLLWVTRTWPLPKLRSLLIYALAGVLAVLAHSGLLLTSHLVFGMGAAKTFAGTMLLVARYRLVSDTFVLAGLGLLTYAYDAARAPHTRVSAKRLESAEAEAQVPARPERITRLLVPDANGRLVIQVRDLVWIEAQRYYVRLHARTGSHLIRMSLNELEARLDPDEFVRVSRSAIVQLAAVARLRPVRASQWDVTLQDGTSLRVSPARRGLVEARLSGATARTG